jgi:quercetin dioxygenase-like cupin family protein
MQAMDARARIIRAAGEGERRAFLGGGLMTWKLTAEDTGGAFFLLEDTMTRGKTTPLHLHPEADETVYVIDGTIMVKTDGEDALVEAGGITYTPRGVPHAFIVVSESATLLTWQTPGIGQPFYRDASEPTTSDNPALVDITRIQTSAQQNPHSITILGPPPFEPLEVS